MSMSQTMSGLSSPKSKMGSSLISQSSFHLRGSPSKYRQKKKKLTQLTLIKRGAYRVFDIQGIDRTPKLLYDNDYQTLEEWQPTVLDYVDADLGSDGSQVNLTRTLQPTGSLSYGSRQQNSVSLQMSLTNIANVDSYKDSYKESTKTLEGDLVSETRSEDRISEAPSAFRLRDLPSREFYPPHSKVRLMAKETDSFTMFSMNSAVESSTAEDADAIKQDNELYEYVTYGKGKYSRKLNTSEQQTTAHISTSEATLHPRVLKKNNSSWVTVWKFYDDSFGITEDKKDDETIPIEEQWAQLAEDEKLLRQSLIMERILGGPSFRETQLTYRKSLRLNPMNLDVQFTYSAQTLWICVADNIQRKPVTAIALNSHFPDIMAIGYGKFYYNEPDKGYICIWCAKNPKHPERKYRFSSSVNCLDFSSWSPNLLAAGFLNGDLFVLDISSMEKKIKYRKNSVLYNTYEKILFTKWWVCIDLFGREEERLMVTTGDGRIFQFNKKLDNVSSFQMMRLTKLEGKVKGIDDLRQCVAEEIPMLRFPAARCVVRYPNDHQYYLVSSDDGTIHKCSTYFFTQHVESFLAHSGPVYALKFSPFCNKVSRFDFKQNGRIIKYYQIFLTCGADGAVRLWVWDIFEPLITLTLGPNSVEDAAWSPRNSTIIASISECNLYLWDLRRKTYNPASIIVHPDNTKFCSLEFTKTGDNIILGDMEGCAYVMALYGMPFEEIHKEDTLAACIKKELVVKPKILKLLQKSGPPFSS